MEEEKKLIEQAKKTSVKEAAAYSLMDGFGSRYIIAFANSLGASNSQIGLISSIPSLLSNLTQLMTPKLMENHSRKSIVFFNVLLQSLMWLTLVFLSIAYFSFNMGNNSASTILIIIYTILIIFGAVAAPAWSSWMKDLVTENRGHYFGRRSKIAGTLALIFMLIAGFILDYFKQTNVFIGFIILFSLAFVGRFISAMLFTRQYEPQLKLSDGYYFSFIQFIKKMPFNNFGRFTLFISLLNLSCSIASPFFAIFLLENLQLNSIKYGYILFTLITMATSVTTLLLISLWGRFADKYGNYETMRLCGYFIPIIPLFWLASAFMIGHLSIYLIVIFLILGEFISGIIWAGFNLAAGNYIYDAVTRDRIAICVAYHSVINGAGVFLGAILGGYISSLSFSFLGLSSLLFIFLLSIIARAIVVRIMIPRIKEVRENVTQFKEKDKFEKIERSIKHFHIANFLLGLHNRMVKPRASDLS